MSELLFGGQMDGAATFTRTPFIPTDKFYNLNGRTWVPSMTPLHALPP